MTGEPVGVDDDFEVLQGGVGNAGAVVRMGGHVLRPTSAYTSGIHELLAYLHGRGFDAVPQVVGIEPDGRERLVFIPGDVPVPPFPDWSTHNDVLASITRLFRRYHDAVAGFEPSPEMTWSPELRDPDPGEHPVACHNDVCPENVVFRDGHAIALLDFEFAAPGRRLWDLAALAMMCIPLDTPEDAARTGRGRLDPITRLAVVADAYGLDGAERVELLDILDARLANGGGFVRHRVEAGEPAFVEMWNQMGGQARYDRRHAWFIANRPRLDASATGAP